MDFEVTWRSDIFSDAPQASSAAEFGTVGINFRARKASNDAEWDAALAALNCAVPDLRNLAITGVKPSVN